MAEAASPKPKAGKPVTTRHPPNVGGPNRHDHQAPEKGRAGAAGLGILLVRKRAPRMGRNPMTGEAIKIKASKKVAFRAAKDLKMAI